MDVKLCKYCSAPAGISGVCILCSQKERSGMYEDHYGKLIPKTPDEHEKCTCNGLVSLVLNCPKHGRL